MGGAGGTSAEERVSEPVSGSPGEREGRVLPGRERSREACSEVKLPWPLQNRKDVEKHEEIVRGRKGGLSRAVYSQWVCEGTLWTGRQVWGRQGWEPSLSHTSWSRAGPAGTGRGQKPTPSRSVCVL